MNTILEVLAPVLTILVTILVTTAIPAAFRFLQAKGIEIEAGHREALQSALTNAAMIALAKGMSGRIPIDAVDYVKASVPDAVRRFGLDDGRIVDMIQPKLTAAMMPVAPTGVGPANQVL